MILDFAAKNKPIAAICAAPMVLGKLGLLKGKKATCYPSFEQYLEEMCIRDSISTVRDDLNVRCGVHFPEIFTAERGM